MVEWAVDFYQEADGTAPVEEFLNSLRAEARAKALALLQSLKVHGPSLPFPLGGTRSGFFTSQTQAEPSFWSMDS